MSSRRHNQPSAYHRRKETHYRLQNHARLEKFNNKRRFILSFAVPLKGLCSAQHTLLMQRITFCDIKEYIKLPCMFLGLADIESDGRRTREIKLVPRRDAAVL